MKREKLKELLDSCFTAKRITETMAELPDGFKPRHIHIIDAVYELSKGNSEVRVSDVSRWLNITTPSVTKLINELEDKEVLYKYSMDDDRRVTLVSLTDLGLSYEKKYVIDYHNDWIKKLSDISDEDADTAIAVIDKLMKSML